MIILLQHQLQQHHYLHFCHQRAYLGLHFCHQQAYLGPLACFRLGLNATQEAWWVLGTAHTLTQQLP